MIRIQNKYVCNMYLRGQDCVIRVISHCLIGVETIIDLQQHGRL